MCFVPKKSMLVTTESTEQTRNFNLRFANSYYNGFVVGVLLPEWLNLMELIRLPLGNMSQHSSGIIFYQIPIWRVPKFILENRG